MRIDNIYPLQGTHTASEDDFGSKISQLSRLAKVVSVPKGFYISFGDVGELHESNFDEKSKNKLREQFNILLGNSNSKRLIVRSSMSVENMIRHQFPGIFSSFPNITGFEDLQAAIFRCCKSSMSESVKDYVSFIGISINTIRVSVLIQEQIDPIYSGLAHLTTNSFSKQDYIEIVKGPPESLMQGIATPSVFYLNNKNRNYSLLKAASHSSKIKSKDLEKYVQEFHVGFKKIKDEIKQDIIVEFLIDNYGLKIIQARHYDMRGVDPLRFDEQESPIVELDTRSILADEGKYGLKGAAMLLFSKLSMFNVPVIFIEPNTPLFQIKDKIAQTDFGSTGITVRYSKGNEIGLPRFFAANKEVAFSKLVETYNSEYFIIIHSYLEITRSYELVADDDYLVLEHVPGLWEAYNTLEPDVVILDKEEVTILKVKDIRQKIITTPFATQHIAEEPVSTQFLIERLSRVIEKYNTVIKPRFLDKLPLNFHFVELENGSWVFLNIRRIGLVARKFVRGGRFFHVRNSDDLLAWNGKTPILLKLAVDRGREKDLIGLAQSLPKGGIEVFICFGYLSHPALLLREFGINLVPAYLDRDIVTLVLNTP